VLYTYHSLCDVAFRVLEQILKLSSCVVCMDTSAHLHVSTISLVPLLLIHMLILSNLHVSLLVSDVNCFSWISPVFISRPQDECICGVRYGYQGQNPHSS
jgi:hypothetical protein